MRALAVLLLLTSTVEARPWYREFYARFGFRDSYSRQQAFHAWAAFSFGVGYRYERDGWGIDGSVLNFQYDPEEGLHTPIRVLPYLERNNVWVGAGLSYGWLKGTVDEPLAKRRGQGPQAELALGYELPANTSSRFFVQGALTAPLYNLYDLYQSGDSGIYVFAVEAALGIRF